MSDEPKTVRNLRILVVDDDPDVLEMLVEYLLGKGFEVLGVADGEEALRRLADFRPHLVLLDLLLPGLSGLETLQRIRALPRETRVVVISGTEDVEIARRAVALGAVEYVTKPVDLTYLDSVLEIHTLMDQMDP
jgi:CheY-like chemotaxis protein